jgi:hypothetical protein
MNDLNHEDRRKIIPREDDWFLVPVFVVLFLVVILNHIIGFDLPPLIISVSLAAAIAVLVFRFLGGIGPGTTFRMGVFKAGGSLGALIGSAFLFNAVLQDYEDGKVTLGNMFSPHWEQWIALDRVTGVPVKVDIKGLEESLDVPVESPFRRLLLSIKTGGVVVPESSQDFVLGVLNESELDELTHEIKFDNFLVTDELKAGSSPIDLNPIPFRFTTKRYDKDYSRYALLDQAGNEIYNGSIKFRGAEFVTVSDAILMVAVVFVDHRNNPDPTAKFAFGMIRLIDQFPVEGSHNPSASDLTNHRMGQ